MKQATGELNMSIVVIITVAILAAFFYTTIWPTLRNNFDSKSKCSNAVCNSKKIDENGMAECKIYDKKGNQQGGTFKCVWKG